MKLAQSYMTAANKDCSVKFRSKHSTVLLLCLLRNLMEQTLHNYINSFGFFHGRLRNNDPSFLFPLQQEIPFEKTTRLQ